MDCYITYCIKGFLAFNDDNELICEKLFPEDEIINRLIEIDSKQIVKEELEIIDEVSKTVKAEGFVAWPQKKFVLTIPQTVQYNGNSYTVTQIANCAFCCKDTSVLVPLI